MEDVPYFLVVGGVKFDSRIPLAPAPATSMTCWDNRVANLSDWFRLGLGEGVRERAVRETRRGMTISGCSSLGLKNSFLSTRAEEIWILGDLGGKGVVGAEWVEPLKSIRLRLSILGDEGGAMGRFGASRGGVGARVGRACLWWEDGDKGRRFPDGDNDRADLTFVGGARELVATWTPCRDDLKSEDRIRSEVVGEVSLMEDDRWAGTRTWIWREAVPMALKLSEPLASELLRPSRLKLILIPWANKKLKGNQPSNMYFFVLKVSRRMLLLMMITVVGFVGFLRTTTRSVSCYSIRFFGLIFIVIRIVAPMTLNTHSSLVGGRIT